MTRKALFIGGTGTISTAIVSLLAKSEKWDVAVLNRGKNGKPLPDRVERIVADINAGAAAKKALADRRFDMVADFIAFTPDQVQRDIDLFAGRTRQYFFISSASAYQKPVLSLPITEGTPLHNPYWQYSRDKIACEDLLSAAYRTDGFPAVVIRPSHTYDNNDCPTAVRGSKNAWQTLERMRQGKPVIIHGDGTSLWTLTHADDFAQAFVGLAGNAATIGQTFHITSDDVLTWNQIHEYLAGALGVPLKAVHVASQKLARHNREYVGSLLGDKANSVVFDNSKVRKFVPEYNPTIRFSDAVHTIVGTMLSKAELQIPDPEFDSWCDRMVADEGK